MAAHIEQAVGQLQNSLNKLLLAEPLPFGRRAKARGLNVYLFRSSCLFFCSLPDALEPLLVFAPGSSRPMAKVFVPGSSRPMSKVFVPGSSRPLAKADLLGLSA
jgi:hypothetical protein